MRESLICAVAAGGAVAVMGGVRLFDALAPSRRRLAAFSAIAVFVATTAARPDALVLSDLAVVLGAIGGAVLVGRSLGSIGAIIAFAITMAIVDLVSFGGGLTRRIVRDYRAGSSDLLRYLALTVPLNGRPTPLVGVGDLFAVGALFGGLVRVHRRTFRAAAFMLGGLVVAIAVGLVAGGAPGLPFLALAAALDGAMSARRSRTRHEAKSEAE